MCVCVCLSSIGGQTTRPIITKFGTHMRIDLGMVPTKNWPHEWPGSVGSLGPISESGLSCQLLLRAVVGGGLGGQHFKSAGNVTNCREN